VIERVSFESLRYRLQIGTIHLAWSGLKFIGEAKIALEGIDLGQTLITDKGEHTMIMPTR